jgi:hypothetical protein
MQDAMLESPTVELQAVSPTSLSGAAVLNVCGLVVTAGFIDLHWHGQTQVRDGVTSALEMEGCSQSRSGMRNTQEKRWSTSVRWTAA